MSICNQLSKQESSAAVADDDTVVLHGYSLGIVLHFLFHSFRIAVLYSSPMNHKVNYFQFHYVLLYSCFSFTNCCHRSCIKSEAESQACVHWKHSAFLLLDGAPQKLIDNPNIQLILYAATAENGIRSPQMLCRLSSPILSLDFTVEMDIWIVLEFLTKIKLRF